MYKIGIIGLGVVGKGIQKLFGDDVTAVYDPTLGYEEKDLFKIVDLAVVCVPTPTAKDGMSCDSKMVIDSCSWLHEISFKGVVLIKSTIVPSELRKIRNAYAELRLVFSPEFLGESKYFTPPWRYPDPSDMKSHTWQVFGGFQVDTTLCVDVFKRKMGVDCRFWQTDLMTASLAKYIENSFFATKVTFVNEWAEIAKNFGVDWNELREIWLLDPRVNRNHTLVFPKDRGYGGKCYPKDVKAIIADSSEQGYTPGLMTAVNNVNEKFRKQNER